MSRASGNNTMLNLNPPPVGTVSIEPRKEGELDVGGDKTTVDFTIPAGAFKVMLKNVGMDGDGIDAVATYNGAPFAPDPHAWIVLEASDDPVSEEFKRLPAINIITNGAEIWYSIKS